MALRIILRTKDESTTQPGAMAASEGTGVVCDQDAFLASQKTQDVDAVDVSPVTEIWR